MCLEFSGNILAGKLHQIKYHFLIILAVPIWQRKMKKSKKWEIHAYAALWCHRHPSKITSSLHTWKFQCHEKHNIPIQLIWNIAAITCSQNQQQQHFIQIFKVKWPSFFSLALLLEAFTYNNCYTHNGKMWIIEMIDDWTTTDVGNLKSVKKINVSKMFIKVKLEGMRERKRERQKIIESVVIYIQIEIE